MTRAAVRAKGRPLELMRLPTVLGAPTPHAVAEAARKNRFLLAAALTRGQRGESVKTVRPSPQHLGHGAQIAIRDGRREDTQLRG